MDLAKKSFRWRKVTRENREKAEAFLKAREKFCVSASARFINMNENRDHLWYLGASPEKMSALLLYSRHSLFPVFGGNFSVPDTRFLNHITGKIQIHALQGLKRDVEILGTLIEHHGYFASECIDYSLMNLDKPSSGETFRAGPADLILRPPEEKDTETLFALQAAYEREEVVPKNGEFNPSASRLNLRHILTNEQILIACLGKEIVGKINTSAESFTHRQIGGVYVRPDCRRLGIGQKMTVVFVEKLLAQGKAVSLFVKKRNIPALKIYGKAGFSVLEDYRISYL